MLDLKFVEKATENVVSKIIYYPETDSTNLRAKVYAKENSKIRECAVFVADSQTAGRGRHGRSFCSNAGAGIYMSFLIYPDKMLKGASILDMTKITPYLAVRLCEAIEEQTSLCPEIKWVNDLYVNGKKLAGILVEGEATNDGKIDYLVCGLGINVYKSAFPEEITNIATSVEDALGEKISREKLLASIIDRVICGIGEMTSKKVFDSYVSRLNTLGKAVTVLKRGESYEAEVLSINDDYSLNLKLKDRSVERLFTGEVSIRTK